MFDWVLNKSLHLFQEPYTFRKEMFGETSLNQLLFLAYNLLKQENKNCKLKILAYQVSKSYEVSVSSIK